MSRFSRVRTFAWEQGWRIAADLTTLLVFAFGLSVIVFLPDERSSVVLLCGAALADVLDGAFARRAGGSSLYGKWLDVVADFTAFGLAPAWIIAQHAARIDLPLIISVGVYLFAALWRLYRSQRLKRSQPGYIGLPMPAAAGLVLGIALSLLPLGSIVGLLLTSLLAVSRRPNPTLAMLWHTDRFYLVSTLFISLMVVWYSYALALLILSVSTAAYPWLRPVSADGTH
jgi:phosphatidylserine synthase